MPFTKDFCRLLVLGYCVVCVPTGAKGSDTANPTDPIVTVKIKLDERSMILVPVSLNGSAPYDFLLDTGCSRTIVDKKLAKELGLLLVREVPVAGVLGPRKMQVAQVNTVSIGGATVHGGEVLSADHAANVAGRIHGILGEDFLRNFDVFIDYRHRVLRLETAPGFMAEASIGEHLQLQIAETNHTGLTHNRLVVSGTIQELGTASMSFLLDSGTNEITLFRDNPETRGYPKEPIQMGNLGHWSNLIATVLRIHSLNLGRTSVPNLQVLVLSHRDDVDTDGLLPTSLFHSLLISHTGRFVVLNPSFSDTNQIELSAR